MTTPCADVIEISLKFERTHQDDANSICNDSAEKCNLNFLELSHKTLKDICSNGKVHQCVGDLLQHVMVRKPETINTSPSYDETPNILKTANVIVHQPEPELMTDIKMSKRNSSLRSSLKSSHSMETVLDKTATRMKDKSPDEPKAKSVSHLNDEDDEGGEFENGESIELIFISDEFVNKVQKQQQEMIILDDKDGKRRESLTSNKKIVIITDEFKNRVLRNNSIIVTNEKKMMKNLKLKRSKTYSTTPGTTPLGDDENQIVMESKEIHKNCGGTNVQATF